MGNRQSFPADLGGELEHRDRIAAQLVDKRLHPSADAFVDELQPDSIDALALAGDELVGDGFTRTRRSFDARRLD